MTLAASLTGFPRHPTARQGQRANAQRATRNAQPVHAGVFAPEGSASFAGLWVDNDDNTDVNYLAAVARVALQILRLDSVLEIVRERTGDEARVESVRAIYGQIKILRVEPGEGSTLEYEEYQKGWTHMREGIVVEAMQVGTRNPLYKKWSTRTRRPLINFDTCIKCTQCWLQCRPDECFEVTPQGTYEVVYEACIGCSICAEVCPVPDCVSLLQRAGAGDLKTRVHWIGVRE